MLVSRRGQNEPDRLFHKRNLASICRFKDRFVVLAPRRRRYVLDPTPCGTIDVVREREEGIARTGNLAQLFQPLVPFLCREWLRRCVVLELAVIVLPLGFAPWRDLAAAQHVDCVALVWSLGSFLPFEVQCARVEAHPPVVCLVSGETRAVDATLLSGAEDGKFAPFS